MCLFEIDVFEVDASAIKSLVSGVYNIIKKLIVRCLHCRVHVIGGAYATGMHPGHRDTGKTRFCFYLGQVE